MSKQFFADTEVVQQDTTRNFDIIADGTRTLCEFVNGEVKESKAGNTYIHFAARIIAAADASLIGRFVWDNLHLSPKAEDMTRDKFIAIVDDASSYKTLSGDVEKVAADMIDIMQGCTFEGVIKIEPAKGEWKAKNTFQYINNRRRFKSEGVETKVAKATTKSARI